MSRLIVNEIFHSIQGESSRSGLPCVFVRLTACNLRCTYCDTAYAFTEGTPASLEEILTAIRQYRCHRVEITGGEPLLQEGVHELMTRLCDLGYEVLLETSGSLDISAVDGRVRRIVDFKCPGSGMQEKNLWGNVPLLRATDEVKFVVAGRADFDWSLARAREEGLLGRVPVIVSPVFGQVDPADLAAWVLESGEEIRMQIQLHKVIWDPSRRGV
jgi:7-carboxy-7-deazaguanine synthase